MPCPLHNELLYLCEYIAGKFVFHCWEFFSVGHRHCFPVLIPLSLPTLLSTIKCLSSAVFFGTAAFLALFNSSCIRGVAYLKLGVVEELFKYFFTNSRTATEGLLFGSSVV